MKILPRKNRVLVEPISNENKTKSGLIIPETASKEKPMIATVLEIGGGSEVKDLKKGNKIIYSKYSGVEVKYDGGEYLILNGDDIIGIIEGGN